jgi:hypothetical protein
MRVLHRKVELTGTPGKSKDQRMPSGGNSTNPQEFKTDCFEAGIVFLR